LGKKLLKNEIEISRKSKKNKIRATIHEHNVDSVKLHQSLGFKIEGKFVNEEFYDEYWTVLSLALFLD
jgi:L-amino acid N-acyltransferase YncA